MSELQQIVDELKDDLSYFAYALSLAPDCKELKETVRVKALEVETLENICNNSLTYIKRSIA